MTSGHPDPVERAAADADDARNRIAATIDELQGRLDPRRIVGDAVDKVQDTGTELLGDARAIVTRHPIALGAAVVAVALAFFARRTLARATVDLGDGLGDYTDYDDETGFSGDGEPRPAASDAATSSAANDWTPVNRLQRGAIGARVGSVASESPLGTIVAGLAAGAVLGALFPSTTAERRALGDSGARIGAAARAAMARAGDEFESAGLSVAGLQAQAGEVGRTAQRAAQAAMTAARSELKTRAW